MSAPGEPRAEGEAGDRGFDWESPRWRESDGGQGQLEQRRRFRNQVAPQQRGAIDEAQSVPRGPEGGREPTLEADSER